MRENKTERQRKGEREGEEGREREGGVGGGYVLDKDKLTIVIACTTLQLMSVDL